MTERIAGFKVDHLHGPEEIRYKDDEFVVVCVVRDGEPWVRSFVEHYLSMGARHLVFLDNNSTDDTVSAASEYDNVTVLRTTLPFGDGVEGAEGQNLMRRYLIERFGRNRWSLCVDMDELFDYPYSDVIGLDSLLRYLSSKSYTAVTAQMLDMFPEKLSVNSTQETITELKEEYRFYDISKIDRSRLKKDKHALRNNIIESDEVAVGVRGGIRENVFGYKPLLTKYPLLYSDGTSEHMGVHVVRNARVADLTCVLFHYKFYAFALRDYWYKAIEYKRGRGWFMRRRYEQYAEVLEKKPELHLKLESSREIASVNDLLEDGFLVASEDYISWVGAEEERSFSKGSQDEHGPSVEAFLEARRQDREKALRLGSLERRLRAYEQQGRAKTRRIRAVKRKLGIRTREAQELGQTILGNEQRISDLEGQLRDRHRRLQRFRQRSQRLKQRNYRLTQRMEHLEASRLQRVISIIRTIKARLRRKPKGDDGTP